VALIGALFSACSRDPNVRKQKYLQSAQRYFEKGKYNEAAIEYVNALKIDPGSAEAHFKLAESYLKMQQPLRAYNEFARTVELQPDNYRAHFEMANLLIASRNFRQAQEQTDLLLQKQPNDPQTHFAVSSLLTAEGNLPAAIEEMQKAIALGSNQWTSHLSLAFLQLKNNQPDAAEANLKKAVELSSNATGPQLALGLYYQARGRFSEAEQQFRHAMETDPKSPEARAALSRLYLVQGRKADAEEVAKQAKRDLPNNSDGYRMLGDFYAGIGDLEKATAEYNSLYHEHHQDIQVKKNYIQLLIQENRLDDAREMDNEILKVQPSDSDALEYRAEMQLRDGHPDDAAQTLQTIIKNDPDDAAAHYHLGSAFDKSGNLERAEGEWREAVRLRADLVEAQRSLAGVAMRKGDMSALGQAATQIISLQPTSPDGYALRAVSEINLKQFSAAEQDVRKAIEVAPQNPVGYVQIGNLRFAQEKYSDAEKAYQEALDRDANSRDALRGLMNAYIAQKQIDKAISAANVQIAKSPNNSGFYDLLGTVLFHNKKDLSGATAAFEKSAALDRNNSDALLKLAQVQAAQGSVDQALATCQQSIKDHPREANFYVAMGELYESRQDWSKATDGYQKALEIKPQDPMISNHLASAIMQSGGNLDIALSLAQTARRGMPDSPNAADTLGWVLYQKGAYKSAIDLFLEALKLGAKSNAPDNPAIHYHLGMAYQKTDQPALARQQLERVLKIDPNYSGAADVKKQLAQLRS